MISAEQLIAGSALTYEFSLPPALVPKSTAKEPADGGEPKVRLRPLTVHDLQLIARAAKESDTLTATLMVSRALVEPSMSVGQVQAMPVGLVQFLLARVNEISGISVAAEQIADALTTPIARAAFVLSREFGWTQREVQELTLGQILVHLEMLKESAT